MLAKFTLTMTCIVLLISLAGCGSINQANPNSSGGSSNSQSNPSRTVTDTTDADNYQMLPIISSNVASVKLDASADGSTQKLKKGEAISITLESNPSTGYSWIVNISNTDVLIEMAEPEFQGPTGSATPMVGASGTQTFYFQAANTGSATLTLQYQRSWESNVTPEKTITITVEVQ